MDQPFEAGTRYFAEMLATIPDFILTFDRLGVIQYINRVEEGYDRDKVIGASASAILHPDSMEGFNNALRTTFETHEEQQYEAMIIAPDGTSQWYRSRMFPMERNGVVIAALLIGSNITELKAAREALEQLRRLLPICAWCDRIRNEEGKWEGIATYLKATTGTDVTHGLCPDCAAREMRQVEATEGVA